MAKDFKDLEIWQIGQEIALKVYQITKNFPRAEIFGLTSQMRRSAISVPSNISEGFNRFYQKEFRQFLFVALGSLAELETQINIGHQLDYINKNDYINLTTTISREAKMIRSLIQKLKILKPTSRTQTLEPRTNISILDSVHQHPEPSSQNPI